MKKNNFKKIGVVFILISGMFYTTYLSQESLLSSKEANKQLSYEILKSVEGVDLSFIDNFSMLDLYRNNLFDNILYFPFHNDTVIVKLFSADKLDTQGIKFDMGLVEKGIMMHGKQTDKKKYKIELNPDMKNIKSVMIMNN